MGIANEEIPLRLSMKSRIRTLPGWDSVFLNCSSR
jgi:hypothetical protein